VKAMMMMINIAVALAGSHPL